MNPESLGLFQHALENICPSLSLLCCYPQDKAKKESKKEKKKDGGKKGDCTGRLSQFCKPLTKGTLLHRTFASQCRSGLVV